VPHAGDDVPGVPVLPQLQVSAPDGRPGCGIPSHAGAGAGAAQARPPAALLQGLATHRLRTGATIPISDWSIVVSYVQHTIQKKMMQCTRVLQCTHVRWSSDRPCRCLLVRTYLHVQEINNDNKYRCSHACTRPGSLGVETLEWSWRWWSCTTPTSMNECMT
jgi:hypothetical protein